MIKKNNISFKDDAARVVNSNNIYYRYIFQDYKLEYDHLMDSGLYLDLLTRGLIIEHKEVFLEPQNFEYYKLILPFQIPFQSYPFEWSYYQWKKAILAYLEINLIALNYGMILKDASPYNFFLNGGNAILLDTSSFIFFSKNDRWIAYRQFCEEFLSPFSLMYFNSPEWSKITMSHLRGINLRFVSQHLPLKSYFDISVFLNIHLQARFLNKKEFVDKNVGKGFGLNNLFFTLNLLNKSIKKWDLNNIDRYIWSNYYEKDIESQEYIDYKEKIVRQLLFEIKPSSVLDLGANTGKFSFLSSEFSDRVIALESDYNCVDIIEKRIEQSNNNKVYVVNAKISEFSNGLGLDGQEYKSLSLRIFSELVLALALVHHLYIVCYLSFDQIAEQISKLCSKYLIIEFIPESDPKIVFLLQSKNRKLLNYNVIEFEHSMCFKFKIIKKIEIFNSSRIIYLFEKL